MLGELQLAAQGDEVGGDHLRVPSFFFPRVNGTTPARAGLHPAKGTVDKPKRGRKKKTTDS